MTRRNNVTEAQKTVTEQRDTSSRARTPSFGGLSRCHGVTAKRDVTTDERDSVLRDTTVGLEAAALGEQGRTRIGELCLVAARSVMAEVDAGRSVDPLRVQWAEQMLAGNGQGDGKERPTTTRAHGDPA